MLHNHNTGEDVLRNQLSAHIGGLKQSCLGNGPIKGQIKQTNSSSQLIHTINEGQSLSQSQCTECVLYVCVSMQPKCVGVTPPSDK